MTTTDTQPLTVSLQVAGRADARRVEWPLDGPTLAALLADHCASLGAPAPSAATLLLEGRPVDRGLTLRDALSQAGLAPDPGRAFALALAVVAPAAAPGMRPGAPPPSMHRPPAPVQAPAPAVHRPPAMAPPAPAQPPAPHDEPPAKFGNAPAPTAPVPTPGNLPINSVRRATVEYYARMNPQKVFPLKVTLAPWSMDRKLAPDVARAVSDAFTVDPSRWIEVEPVLPGCAVYPAKLLVPGGPVLSELRFWVVPQVLGEVPGTVYVRNGDQQRLVRLKARVAEPRRAAWTAALGFVLPYATVAAKHYHLDFESQLGAGFPLYGIVVRGALRAFGPGELFALLLLLAAALWLRARPRKATATEDDADARLYAT